MKNFVIIYKGKFGMECPQTFTDDISKAKKYTQADAFDLLKKIPGLIIREVK